MSEPLSPAAEKILEYVRNHGDATFANLQDLFGEDAKGDLVWEISPNCYIWAGMSQHFVDAVQEVRPLLDMDPSHYLVYAHDGHMPADPVAARPTSKGYKTPHWLPVIFHLKR